MERKVTQLNPVAPVRESAQEIIFHFDGSLTASRFPDGRWPLFAGGDIFEVWLAVTAPSDKDITVPALLYSPRNHAIPTPISSFVLPAGQYQRAISCDIDVERGGALTAALEIDETTTIPAYGLVAIFRVSS